MRSWIPRRPSPQIERQLFGTESRASLADRRIRRPRLPWYQTLGATAVACLVLVLTILNFTQLANGRSPSRSASFFPLSNGYMAMISAPHNTWTAPILGWTNLGGYGSSIRSFDLLNTNRPR